MEVVSLVKHRLLTLLVLGTFVIQIISRTGMPLNYNSTVKHSWSLYRGLSYNYMHYHIVIVILGKFVDLAIDPTFTR